MTRINIQLLCTSLIFAAFNTDATEVQRGPAPTDCYISNAVDYRAQFGGKAANLRFLSTIKEANVPAFELIPCAVFTKCVQERLGSDVEQLYKMFDVTPVREASSLFPVAEKLREKIHALELSSQLTSYLREIYDKMSTCSNVPVVVRSSSTVEDAEGGSFAGLYDSVLNLRAFENFLSALKEVWASNFSNRAIKYYLEKGINIKKSAMGAIVQEMMEAKSSGTAFSIDPSTGYNGISITANLGPGAVVDGEDADVFIFTDGLSLIKSFSPPKKSFYRVNTNTSGLNKVELSSGITESSLTMQEARRVAQILNTIRVAYGQISSGPVDTEFCLTTDGIRFVQVRPLVVTAKNCVRDIAPDTQNLEVIAAGQYSVSGVSQGRLKIIDAFSKLESGELTIEPEDVVVAHRTENQWSQYFTKFQGIISMEGNPTAHPMLVATEHGVPCVIGVPDAVARLLPYNGKMVTIDGFRKRVYLGTPELVEVPISQISELFSVVMPEVLPSIEALVDEGIKKGKMFKDLKGDVWFVKPDTRLSGALLQMQLLSFPYRNTLLERAGAKLKTKIEGEQQAIRGKVFEKILGSLQEQVDWLQSMNLGDFETYYKQEEGLYVEYLDSCKKFDIHSVASWDRVCKNYTDLCAYMWLSFITRTSKLQRMFDLGRMAGIPRIYFNEFEEQIQSRAFQEDSAFRHDMICLKQKFLQSYAETDIDKIDPKNLKDEHPDLYFELVKMSQTYKFTDCIDWKNPISLQNVLKRLSETPSELVNPNPESQFSYFLDNPELTRWMTLGILSKIQQNNGHHIRVRGQWMLRDKLLELAPLVMKPDLMVEYIQEYGRKILKPFVNSEEILDMSVEQIRSFIESISDGK